MAIFRPGSRRGANELSSEGPKVFNLTRVKRKVGAALAENLVLQRSDCFQIQTGREMKGGLSHEPSRVFWDCIPVTPNTLVLFRSLGIRHRALRLRFHPRIGLRAGALRDRTGQPDAGTRAAGGAGVMRIPRQSRHAPAWALECWMLGISPPPCKVAQISSRCRVASRSWSPTARISFGLGWLMNRIGLAVIP